MLTRESRLIGPGSPFELIDTALDGITYRTYRHAPKTLNDVYRRAARSQNHELLVQGNSRLNNATVLQRAAALGHLLRDSFHIADGMRVGVSLDNRPEWLIAFIAVTSINATAVILPGEIDPAEAASALESTDCTVVITDNVMAERLAGCGFRGSTLVTDIGAHNEGRAFAIDYSSCPDPEQLAMIAFTSGSSGPAKGVRISHRGLMHGMMNMLLGAALNTARVVSNNKAARITSAPLSLLTAPFSHVSGYSHLLLMLFLNGTAFALPDWDPAVARSIIKREAITTLSGATPQMVRELISHAPPNGVLDSLRSIGIHGVSLVPGVVAEVTSQLPQVTISTGYGMTETNGTICTIVGPELTQRLSSCGRALPTIEIRIAPDDDKVEAEGEILVRGAMLMQGYCGPSVDPHEVVANEWFATGDRGHVDDEGFLYISDRASNLVTCGGSRISCGRVERSLLDGSLIKEVAVFGGSDLCRGDRLIVVAVPYEMHDRNAQTVLERISAVTPTGVLVPEIIWVDALPHTRSGKLDRRRLMQHLIDHEALTG